MGTLSLLIQHNPDVDSMVLCARYIKGDIGFLAAALNIPDSDLQYKFKHPQGQALQLLQHWWKGPDGGNKHNLARILKSAGFAEAAKWYVPIEHS